MLRRAVDHPGPAINPISVGQLDVDQERQRLQPSGV
jgi:hypothetical protein